MAVPQTPYRLDEIEQAILKGNVQVLEEYGDLQGALKRSIELKKLARKRSKTTIIEGFATCWSTRTGGRRF